MNTEPLKKRWARLHEAAAYSGLTQQTLRNYSRVGLIKLKHVRHAKATRGVTLIDLEELDRIIEEASSAPALLAVNSTKKGQAK